jgi:hypothetical protein
MGKAITQLLQYAFIVWCLVKYRDNFTFYVLCRNFGRGYYNRYEVYLPVYLRFVSSDHSEYTNDSLGGCAAYCYF